MPTDAENVIKVNLYTDNQGVKYLYGSKIKRIVSASGLLSMMLMVNKSGKL